MKTKMKFMMSLLLVFSIAITSCSKDGDVGPAGPVGVAGTNGVDGADGDDGIDGTDGVDGNANVFASDWLEPNESSFSVNNARSKALPFTDNIGSSIRNEGVALVYYDNDVEVKLLPHYSYNTLTGSINKSVESKLNHASRTLIVSIRKYSSDFTENEYLWNATGPAYAKGVRFRYIIIPSNTTSGKSKQPDFKKMNYNEVIDHFNLEY